MSDIVIPVAKKNLIPTIQPKQAKQVTFTVGSAKVAKRILYHGQPGCCKTTFGAFSPKPLFITTLSEDGLNTLMDYGLVPDNIPYVNVKTWPELIDVLNSLHTRDNSDTETLVIDTINGVQDMLVKHVMGTKFGNDPIKFNQWGEGEKSCLAEWMNLINGTIEKIRVELKLRIILLSHCEQVKQKNHAGGAEYYQLAPMSLRKLANAIESYPDFMIFANRPSIVEDKAKREVGRAPLELRFNDGGGYMAKNRANLPDSVVVRGDQPADVWGTFYDLLKGKV